MKKEFDTLVGIVVIGRNEGERLIRCIKSLRQNISHTVYVDSGSTDRSAITARDLGVNVVDLDMSQPFTAARARNAGFEKLMELFPEVELVQFVDGDCEVLDGWIKNAAAFMHENPKVAAVSGVLNERFPNKTIYNKLCDLEWKMPFGEVKACGGNALMRTAAFNDVGGFLPTLIAGEEPELCVRMRKIGWKIWHIEQPMMLHDAAMTNFSQWWKRAVRSGYAFANGAYLHGGAPELHWIKESRRAWIWGGVIPALIIIGFLVNPVIGLLLLLVYPLQVLRLTMKSALPSKVALLQAIFSTMGKFAEMIGQCKFRWHLYSNKQSKLIEYK